MHDVKGTSGNEPPDDMIFTPDGRYVIAGCLAKGDMSIGIHRYDRKMELVERLEEQNCVKEYQKGLTLQVRFSI